MKKILAVAVAMLCASAIVTHAGDAPKKNKKAAKKELSATQKDAMAALLAKYDTNKDGKLDATEKAAMTQEDKDKLAKLVPAVHKKKDVATAAVSAAPAIPATPAVPAAPAGSGVPATPATPAIPAAPATK